MFNWGKLTEDETLDEVNKGISNLTLFQQEDLSDRLQHAVENGIDFSQIVN